MGTKNFNYKKLEEECGIDHADIGKMDVIGE